MSEQQAGKGSAKDAHNARPEDGAGQGEREQSASQQEELTCVSCGHPIKQDDLVCPNCGISLVAG